MRRYVKIIAGATLLVAGLGACDDPLSEGREDGYFQLNPSFAVVAVGGQTTVTAVVMNGTGMPTGDAVSATPCNARITAETDPSRTEFEPPEKFIVRGVSTGASCLVVQGGGLTDTATVNVVAAP